MLRMLRGKRAQNTAEYAILIGIVVAAAVAMQTYVKRSLQAGVKYAVDKANDVDGQGTAGTGQYEPYYQESSWDTVAEQYKETEEMKAGGEVERQYGVDGKTKRTTRSGYQKQRAEAPATTP